MIAPFLPVIAPSLPVQNFHCAVFAELRHVFYIAPFLWTCAWFFCRLGMRPKFWIHESLGMQRDVAPLRNKSLVLWTETELLHWPGEENWGGNFFKLTLAFDLPNLSSRAVQFSKTFVVRLDVFYMWGPAFQNGFNTCSGFCMSIFHQWCSNFSKHFVPGTNPRLSSPTHSSHGILRPGRLR